MPRHSQSGTRHNLFSYSVLTKHVVLCGEQIKLAQLGNFFPRIPKIVRAATLEECKGDLEEAANKLFVKMAELADADDEEDPQAEQDIEEDAEQTKYILRSTHDPSPGLATTAGEDGAGEWKASNSKGKGRKKASPGAEGLAPEGDLALLYSRDEEVAAVTGQAEACGHYEILKGTIDRSGTLAPKAKIIHVVGIHAFLCVRAQYIVGCVL